MIKMKKKMSVRREKKSKKTTPKRTFVELNTKKSPPSIFSRICLVFLERLQIQPVGQPEVA